MTTAPFAFFQATFAMNIAKSRNSIHQGMRMYEHYQGKQRIGIYAS
jgi:hypothetical protein